MPPLAFQLGRESSAISTDSRREVQLWERISGYVLYLALSLAYSNWTRPVFSAGHSPRLLEGLQLITGHGEPSITSLLLSHLALFSAFYSSFLRRAILEPEELISTRNSGRNYLSGGPWYWTLCLSCFYFVVLPFWLWHVISVYFLWSILISFISRS